MKHTKFIVAIATAISATALTTPVFADGEYTCPGEGYCEHQFLVGGLTGTYNAHLYCPSSSRVISNSGYSGVDGHMSVKGGTPVESQATSGGKLWLQVTNSWGKDNHMTLHATCSAP